MKLDQMFDRVVTGMQKAGVENAEVLQNDPACRLQFLRKLNTMAQAVDVPADITDHSVADALMRGIAFILEKGIVPGDHCHFVPFKGKYQVIINWKGMFALLEARADLPVLSLPKLFFKDDDFRLTEDENGSKIFLSVAMNGERTYETLAGGFISFQRRGQNPEIFCLMKQEIDARKQFAVKGRKGLGLWGEWPLEAARKTIVRALWGLLSNEPLFEFGGGLETTGEPMGKIEVLDPEPIAVTPIEIASPIDEGFDEPNGDRGGVASPARSFNPWLEVVPAEDQIPDPDDEPDVEKIVIDDPEPEPEIEPAPAPVKRGRKSKAVPVQPSLAPTKAGEAWV